MRRCPVWLLCCLALSAAWPPLAQAAISANAGPTDQRPALARKLVELTTPLAYIRQGARQMVVAVYRASVQAADPSQNVANRPPAAQAATNAVADAEIDRFMDATAPSMLEQSAQLYAGLMSEEQLRTALGFYQTDAGRKMLMLIAQNTGDQAAFKSRFDMELSPDEQAQVEAFGQSATGRMLVQIGDEASQVVTASFKDAVTNEIPVILQKTGEAPRGDPRDRPQQTTSR
jgi:hypothetical protein